MKRYQLYVNIDGYWELLYGIDADDHRTAFQQAIHALRPEHRDKAIRLEQNCDAMMDCMPELVLQ
jgi:hypothetical protein